MNHQQSTYLYTPLEKDKQQIRLLHLHPPVDGFSDEAYDHGIDANDTSSINCTFSVTSLENCPPYEALSYVWGDAKDASSITLNGHYFPVTSNLHYTLSQVRQTTTTRTLWVDALCINQEDMNERSNQVSLMHQIYSQASSVLISLGKAWEGSDAVIDFIELIGSNTALHFDTSLEPSTKYYSMNFKSEGLQRYLLKFFYLPWWTRIWTAQEWGLACHAVFLCGGRKLDGDLLQSFARNSFAHDACCKTNKQFGMCASEGRSIHAGLQKAALVRPHDVFKNWGYRGFIDMLATFQYRQCSDPLDKVFGLLGLAPKSFRDRVFSDYSLSPEEVYTNVTLAAIAETQNLGVLSYIYGRRSGNLDLPSFVPDFTAAVHDKWVPNYLSRCLVTLEYYNACASSLPNFNIVNPSEATTNAIFVGTVLDTARGPFDSSWEQKLIDCYRLARLSKSCTPKECCTMRNFWKTLCGGIYYNFQGASWFRPVSDEDYSSFLKWQTWVDAGQPVNLEEKEALDFNRAFTTTVAGRKMVVTTQGLVGLAPWRTTAGDVVVIMPGGRVPYVLRPRLRCVDSGYDDGEFFHTQRYQFIGDAYFHGIMHGEAYDQTRLQAITLV